jgi:hypothetical protein
MKRQSLVLYRGVQLIPAPPFTAVGTTEAPLFATDRRKARITATSSRPVWFPCVSVVQAGQVITTRRQFRVMRSGRPVRLPRSLMAAVDPSAGQVLIGLADTSHIPFDTRGSGLYLPLSGP